MPTADTNPGSSGRGRPKRFPADSRIRVANTGSTNADVMAWVASGQPPGAVLVADHQSAGRGRLARTWEASAGDALLTTFLVDAPDVSATLPLVLGVAALDVVHARGGTDAGLKWPNDVVVGSRKLAGILVEAVPVDGAIAGAAAGIGMNLLGIPVASASDSGGSVENAISLRELVGSDDPAIVGVEAVLDDLCDRFDYWLDLVGREPHGQQTFVEAYRERCVSIGQRVRVERIGDDEITGTAVRIDDEGRLLVERSAEAAGGIVVVSAGDVHHLRPA